MKASLLLALCLIGSIHTAANGETQISKKSLTTTVAVLSAAGKPVPGAQVFVCKEESGWDGFRGGVIQEGKTDSAGRFHASVEARDGDENFNYHIIAKDVAGIGFASWHGKIEDSKSTTTSVTLWPFATAKIKVSALDGSPLAGVTLRVGGCKLKGQGTFNFPVNPPPLPDGLWTGKTGADGTCEIGQLPAGIQIYLLHDAAAYAQPDDRHYPSKWLAVDEEEHALSLKPGGTISGQILTKDGTPLPGCSLSVIEEDPYVTSYGASAFADEKGRFVFKQVPGSDYKLTVKVPNPERDIWIGPEELNLSLKPGQALDLGTVTATRTAIVTMRILNRETGEEIAPPIIYRRPAGSHQLSYRSNRMFLDGYERPSDASITVTVDDGEKITVDFKLTPADKKRLITGVVLDLVGKPATHGRVMLIGKYSQEFSSPVPTDENGKFSLVAASDATSFMICAFGENQTQSELLPVKPGERIELLLKKDGFATIKGRVLDDEDNPVKNAHLQRGQGGFDSMFSPVSSRATTDAQGNYEFPLLWNNLKYALSCNAEGYGQSHKQELHPGPGETLTIDFKLPRATKMLSGMVVDSDGNAVAKAWLGGSGEGQVELSTRTDAQGRFHFDKVVPGDIMLEFGIESENLNISSSKSVTAGDKDLRLVLPEARGSFEGVVVDETGKPLPGAKVSSDDLPLISTDKHGRFALKGIVTGWLTLEVSVSDSVHGKRAQRVRVKTGMQDIRVVVPDKPQVDEPLPKEPRNLVGQMAPPIQTAAWLNSMELPPVQTGKVRILDFCDIGWGTSVAHMLKIQKFLEERPDPNLEFIAVHYPTAVLEVQEFLEKHPALKFPVAIAAEGTTMYRDFDVRKYPTYVVVDAAGMILYHDSDLGRACATALQALNQLIPPSRDQQAR